MKADEGEGTRGTERALREHLLHPWVFPLLSLKDILRLGSNHSQGSPSAEV